MIATQRKPAPDPYVRAAALHGLPPASCLALEDSRWGIASAAAAGLRCVAITHTYPPGELRGAAGVIHSLSEFTADYAAAILCGPTRPA